jgi:hypothetical protein
MSEATLQADLQREFLTLNTLFSTGDVTINDWDVLDGPNVNAPYIIIENSDDFAIATIQTSASRLWMIPFTLFVRFLDWSTSEVVFAAARQPVLDKLDVKKSSFSSSSGRLRAGIRSIRSGGPIGYVYDRYVENDTESLPVFISQRIIVEVEEK